MNTTAEEMKKMLENEFDVGKLEVSTKFRVTPKFEHTWKIKWLTKPGRQPQIQINGTKLSGDDVKTTNDINEGGLFYTKIPGEFLRMPTPEPQVKWDSFVVFALI